MKLKKLYNEVKLVNEKILNDIIKLSNDIINGDSDELGIDISEFEYDILQDHFVSTITEYLGDDWDYEIGDGLSQETINDIKNLSNDDLKSLLTDLEGIIYNW